MAGRRELVKLLTKRVGWWLPLTVVGVIVVTLTLMWLYSERIADRSILTDSPCAAPCWYGIVPGDRMATEKVVHILEMLPSVSSVQQNPAEVRWRWKQWPWRRTGYNCVHSVVGERVDYIYLSVDFELTVEEILGKYGVPEAITVVQAGLPEHMYVAIKLLYPTQGLEFDARVLPWNQPVLGPTTEVFEAVYTVPAGSLESWLNSFDFEVHVQPWPGYGELEVPVLD
jgi:hypothetical protein